MSTRTVTDTVEYDDQGGVKMTRTVVEDTGNDDIEAAIRRHPAKGRRSWDDFPGPLVEL